MAKLLKNVQYPRKMAARKLKGNDYLGEGLF